MSTAFERAYAATHAWEKGWANHPRDPGGATMDGITERVFHAFLRSRGAPLRSVRTITEEEKRDIYRRQYWDAVRGEQLPPGIDMAVYDFAVNSGPSRAVRYLQAALGIKQDGAIGEVTLLAANEAFLAGDGARLVARYMDARERFLRALPTFDAFGKGWMNRTRDIRAKAIAAVNKAALTVPKQEREPDIIYRDEPKPPAEPAEKAGEAKRNTLVSLISMIGAAIASAIQQLTGLLAGLPLEGKIVTFLLIAVAIGAAAIAFGKWKEAQQ